MIKKTEKELLIDRTEQQIIDWQKQMTRTLRTLATSKPYEEVSKEVSPESPS